MQKDASTGYSGLPPMCRVKFIPISGYRPDNPGIKLMSVDQRDRGLARLSAGYGYVLPYRIVLPTVVGYGSATSTSFQVSRGARRASLDP